MKFFKMKKADYKFKNDLPEYQPSDIKVGQEVWFDTDEVTDNENNLDIVKEIEDHGIVKEIKKWPYGNREYYMVEVNDGIIVEVGTVYDSEEKRDLAKNRSFSEKFEPISKESAIQQPNKPKPTTMLPDNMTWSWDPNAQDWVAVLKDNTNVTPPLYDPNNQNVVNQTTSYMSAVKSASCLSEFLDGPRYSKEIKIEAGLIKEGLVKYAGFDFNKGTKYAITTKGLEVLRKASEAEHNEALNEREKLAYMFGFNTDEVSTLDTTGKTIKSEGTKKFNVKSLINKLYSEIKKNRGHWEGIDPLEYTYIDAKDVDGGTEIQVRDELSYEGMMKLAELLNKIIKEVDPQAYFEPLEPGIMIAFISDGNNKNASKKLAKKYTICEADGCELGEVEASSELDAKVKFGIEHPEYADSQSINAKEIKSADQSRSIISSNFHKDKRFQLNYPFISENAVGIIGRETKRHSDESIYCIYDPDNNFTYIDIYSSSYEDSYNKSFKKSGDAREECLKYVDEVKSGDCWKVCWQLEKDNTWNFEKGYNDNQSINAKEIKSGNKPFESTMGFYTYEVLWQDNDDKEGEFIEPIRFELCDDRDIDEWSWKCEELFGKEWFYGFLSRKDAMDKVIKELNKWGTIKGEIKQVDSLYTGRLKRLHSNYEQTTNTKEPYPNPSETPHDDIVLENHTGWVNTADQKVTPEFAKLHELLGKYRANDLIQLSELDGNLVASGDPQVINTLEHEVKDIGYYCEAIDEYTDSDYAETYSLKIFMK